MTRSQLPSSIGKSAVEGFGGGGGGQEAGERGREAGAEL